MGNPEYSKITHTLPALSPYTVGTAATAGTVARQIEPQDRAAKLAATLLRRLFRRFDGLISIRLWNGDNLSLGTNNYGTRRPPEPFTLIFRNPAAVRVLVLGSNPLRLVEAYFRGDIDIEGDIFAVLSLREHLDTLQLSLRDRLCALFSALRLAAPMNLELIQQKAHHRLHGGAVSTHSKTENSRSIDFHYNVSNSFYALWLDPDMVYSCAYFEQQDQSLAQAQKAKLDHICRKLMLRAGERFLDIGCGWGALVIHAAKHYGVRAHGITLSQNQLDLARHRIAQEGLEDKVTVELQDYRDLKGNDTYDKISSVGMFEHVGLKNLPAYFSTVNRLLKPSGLFLNHGITHDVEGWTKTTTTEFINRYVFPDGELDTIGNIQRGMERTGFEICDVEALRAHYALTLRRWVEQLEARHDQAMKCVSESTWRVWRLYMAACAMDFESGETGIYQVLSSKRAACATALPLTRRYMYLDAPVFQ
jgi:cyclopropane-fatty-acyl-phospholipid synthase